jgi:hypothetical protein
MRIRKRYAVLIAVAAVAGVALAGVALAAPTSTFTFKVTPSTAPKTTYKPVSLFSDLKTHYTNPGNNNPGGAVDRAQLYLDKYAKVDPTQAAKCADNQLAGKTMAQAMAACKNALVGSGTATATANGLFQINGCVLLFNGKPATSGPDAGLPTLKVFTRVQASNPSTISCANPTTNTGGNATILLNGVLRNATGLYGKVLDVNNITQSAAFPLEEFKTTIGKSTSTYIQAKCPTTPWHTQVTWTYNDNTKKTVSKTQSCT